MATFILLIWMFFCWFKILHKGYFIKEPWLKTNSSLFQSLAKPHPKYLFGMRISLFLCAKSTGVCFNDITLKWDGLSCKLELHACIFAGEQMPSNNYGAHQCLSSGSVDVR